MPPALVMLTVTDVRLAVPAGPGIEAGMVTLCEDRPPRRQLRIIVGQPEARAIHSAWTAAVPARPNTWDLLVSAVSLLDGHLDRAVITGVQEERHWFAEIHLERGLDQRSLSCRPSDAVALALRSFGAGIFTYEEVLSAAGVLADGSRPGATAPDPDREVDPGGGEGTSFT